MLKKTKSIIDKIIDFSDYKVIPFLFISTGLFILFMLLQFLVSFL